MLHLLGYVAVTFIVTRAGIFRWLREIGPKGWRDFVSCPLCAGFWIGLGMALARAALQHQVPWNRQEFQNFTGTWAAESLLELVETGALTGLIALLVACAVDWLDETPKKMGGIRFGRGAVMQYINQEPEQFREELPTDPETFPGPTMKVSDRTITAALKRMAESKDEDKKP